MSGKARLQHAIQHADHKYDAEHKMIESTHEFDIKKEVTNS